MLICMILIFILCQIYEGRIFFKGCVVGSLLTLLPFGILIYTLPQTSNSTLGLILLTTGIVFTIYQGLRASLDPDEYALLGRILRDGLHTPKWYWDQWSANNKKELEEYFKSSRKKNRKETRKDDDEEYEENDEEEHEGENEEKNRPVSLHTPNHLSFSPNYTEEKEHVDNGIPNPQGLRYKTMDGHMVRSKAEMLIANWLTNNHIQYFYEKPVPGTPYFCDFYLPKEQNPSLKTQDVYIEYWGRLDDPEYRMRMELKIEANQKKGIKLMSITDDDIQKDLDATLQEKILFVVPNNTTEKTHETEHLGNNIKTEKKKEDKEERYWE
ncbi:MAG: hypothetical protein L6265_07330 [Thermoplasmatales archaeon]|nr:hypothetical protein [Thermoplasmatales archaeon]